MPIYTKKGDKGTTSTIKDPKTKISKASLLVNAIGNIDELNSFIGIIISQSDDEILKTKLFDIQNTLLTIGSCLAGSRLKITKSKVTKMESAIDEMTSQMPPLKNFVFPGGAKDAANLQFARALSRRAERGVVALSEAEGEVEGSIPNILMYLNRLSDYLFTLARFQNHKAHVADKLWQA